MILCSREVLCLTPIMDSSHCVMSSPYTYECSSYLVLFYMESQFPFIHHICPYQSQLQAPLPRLPKSTSFPGKHEVRVIVRDSNSKMHLQKLEPTFPELTANTQWHMSFLTSHMAMISIIWPWTECFLSPSSTTHYCIMEIQMSW